MIRLLRAVRSRSWESGLHPVRQMLDHLLRPQNKRFAGGGRVSAAVLLLAACGPPESSPTHAVRDSAGIRIVETVVTADTKAPWTVPPEPIFRVGWEEDGPLIENLVSGIILGDGRILVADGGSSLIHVLGPSGDALTTFGGEGAGPREFGQLNGVVRAGGDTILVADGGNSRIALYSGEELVEYARFVQWVGRTAFGFLGRVRDGYALRAEAYYGQEMDPGWHRYPILRLDLELTSLDTVAMVGHHIHPEPGDDNPMRPVGAVSVAGGEIVYGTTNRPELVWMSGDGTVGRADGGRRRR